MSPEKQDIGKTNHSAKPIPWPLSGKGRDNETVTSESQQCLVFADLMPDTISQFFFRATDKTGIVVPILQVGRVKPVDSLNLPKVHTSDLGAKTRLVPSEFNALPCIQ